MKSSNDRGVRAWQRKHEPQANVYIAQSDTARLEHNQRAHVCQCPCYKTGVRVIRAQRIITASVVLVEDKLGQYQRVHKPHPWPSKEDEHHIIAALEYRFDDKDQCGEWDGDKELAERAENSSDTGFLSSEEDDD
jgi:hypothetical protein